MSNETKNKVIKLFITTNDENKKRVAKEKIQIDENGVIEDKFYAKNSNRLILLTTLEAYALATKNGIELFSGALGENILVDADVSHLKGGDTFKIGDALFEVTQNCTLCNGLSILDKKLPTILKDDRGIFVKSLTQVTISIGDVIQF